ncbi:flagellar protein FlaG [Desulfohalobium retbaense]|uniref:Flagellar protein FlaG protein n=1 Tax=Desulfohalobium retbaense (strain ATCC 49708 / DSM 5692 / JCM 16813 / HR100) TaxID=485915 RepID=C8WZ10_DESRD|nr:flagellar protein FlaG [Desulfohalobium retbaense]ACV67926.1 flagellar protein FlaG protein [Desulfohalobium retbaense DSM 5692]
MAIQNISNTRGLGGEQLEQAQPSMPAQRHKAGDPAAPFDQPGVQGKDGRSSVSRDTGAQPAEPGKEYTSDELEDVRQAINETLKDIRVQLEFSQAEETEDLIVKVVNPETEEIIRQIPPEAMVRMAKRMEEMTGLLISEWG